MNRKHFFTLSFGALFAATIIGALSGCKDAGTNSTSPPTNGVVHIVSDSTGDTVSVNVGDTIIFTLGAVGPGNFETPVVSSSAVRFDKMLPLLQNPGGPSGKYQFIAYSRGTATISVSHTVRGVFYTLTIVVS